MIFDNGPSLSRYKKCDLILIGINCYVVVVAQLVERSLANLEVCSLNLVFGNNLY